VLPRTELYEAILSRRSVRRYDKTPLDEGTLARVRDIIAGVLPLVPENDFEILVRDVRAGEDLVKSLGGYGRMVSPPHYLVPYMLGEEHVLEDLGYRAEQIAVRLTALGIGSCYIGALRREDEVRSRFNLPEGARIGAFLIFGRPSAALGGRAFNRLMRVAAGASRKLPVESLFFQDTFDNPATPQPDIAPLIEAARHAPSAVNAQPWRFLWRASQLYLFVATNIRKYGRGPTEHYCFYDGGIAMANVTLAVEGLGMAGQWELLAGTEPHIPQHPSQLRPLATLTLEEKN
jgi:nitroreductase